MNKQEAREKAWKNYQGKPGYDDTFARKDFNAGYDAGYTQARNELRNKDGMICTFEVSDDCFGDGEE